MSDDSRPQLEQGQIGPSGVSTAPVGKGETPCVSHPNPRCPPSAAWKHRIGASFRIPQPCLSPALGYTNCPIRRRARSLRGWVPRFLCAAFSLCRGIYPGWWAPAAVRRRNLSPLRETGDLARRSLPWLLFLILDLLRQFRERYSRIAVLHVLAFFFWMTLGAPRLSTTFIATTPGVQHRDIGSLSFVCVIPAVRRPPRLRSRRRADEGDP